MPQYLADIKETEFFIEGDEARHLLEVARRQPGDEILVFNGNGLQYLARIEKAQKNFARGALLRKIDSKKPGVSLELCFAPSSRTALEEVLDKCTQLGVSSFQLINTARSEYDVSGKWESKMPRWKQIVTAACKQSNAAFIPAIYPPVDFLKATQALKPSLLTYEAEENHTIGWGIEQLGNPNDLRVYVGPAGGWADEEIVIAAQCQILPVTLGSNILRAETACIAAASKIL